MNQNTSQDLKRISPFLGLYSRVQQSQEKKPGLRLSLVEVVHSQGETKTKPSLAVLHPNIDLEGYQQIGKTSKYDCKQKCTYNGNGCCSQISILLDQIVKEAERDHSDLIVLSCTGITCPQFGIAQFSNTLSITNYREKDY